MRTLEFIAYYIAGWFTLGAIVMTLIDDKNGSLLKWAEKEPIPGITLMGWPIVLAAWILWKIDRL